MLPDFADETIEANGVRLHVARGGSGPPLLLLHGYPQTHAMWHRVAPELAERFAVACPDLRGYGDSEAPPGGGDHAAYSKREMAADQIELMRSLGFERFAIAAHDRGARVATRLALDHPHAVSRLAVLDIVPTWTIYSTVDQRRATTVWRYFFLIQPPELPERLIGADPGSICAGRLRSGAAPRARLPRMRSPSTSAASTRTRSVPAARTIAPAPRSTSSTTRPTRMRRSPARFSPCGARAGSAAPTTCPGSGASGRLRFGGGRWIAATSSPRSAPPRSATSCSPSSRNRGRGPFSAAAKRLAQATLSWQPS